MNKIKNEIQKTDGTNELIKQALETKADISILERLFALQKEYKKDMAREAYVQAMSAFQSECPTIKKTNEVKDRNGRVMYMYAPLDVIVETVRPILAKNQLSFSVQTQNNEKEITATCTVTHIQGHSEQSSFTVPFGDGTQVMSAPQKIASAQTYAKRYAFCNVLGILTAEEDTDAIKENDKQPISPKSKIIFLMKSLGHEMQKDNVEEWKAEIKKLAKLDLTEENYDEIIGRLEVSLSERNAQ